ncbi:MAG: hypothetical protein ACREFY_04575 [Acetobacteraceae bacterium]
MPDIEITRVDLAQGLRPKNLEVPPTIIEVVLKNPPTALQKAIADDKLIVQKLAEAAFDKLKDARAAFSDGIKQIDESYGKKPPADEREALDRVKTLNNQCKQIAEAQSAAAVAAAEAEWKRAAKKNKDLAKFDAGFAFKMVVGTISVAASVISAILSMGVLAITILGAAKTVVGMASAVYNFARDMDKTESDIIDTDLALAKTWTDDELTAGKTGKELAAALGVPFVNSIGGLGTLLDEYNAKNARKDKAADEMWKKAKVLMANIEKAPDSLSAEQKKSLDALGKQTTALLNQVGDVTALSKSNDLFYDAYKARLDTYEALRGGRLGATAKLTGGAAVLAGIVSTTNTILDIATKLA